MSGHRSEGNQLQVRVELQADCLAGVWAHHAEEKWRFIEPGDVEAAMQTASAIGDDRLQRRRRICRSRCFHPWLVGTTHALVHDRAEIGAGFKLRYVPGGAALTRTVTGSEAWW